MTAAFLLQKKRRRKLIPELKKMRMSFFMMLRIKQKKMMNFRTENLQMLKTPMIIPERTPDCLKMNSLKRII